MFQAPTEAEILLNGLLNMRHLRNDDLNKLKKQQIELIITELEKETPPVAMNIEISGNQNSSPPTSLSRDETPPTPVEKGKKIIKKLSEKK